MSDLRVPDVTKLIPIESYVDVEHAVPYIYSLQAQNSRLTVFGADHSNDKDHKQFSELERVFAEQEPHCVLLEGIQDEVTFSHLHTLIDDMQPEEAIERGGESVYAAHLALHSGVTWQSAEPADGELYRYLESLGFSRDEVVVWAVLRLLPQYLRRNETISFCDYVEPFQTQIEDVTKWSEAIQSYAEIMQKAQTLIGAEISLTNEDRATRYTTPVAVAEHDGDYTVLNTIAATATAYRDRAILSAIHRALDDFQSVLVVYGASHAVMQEPTLREMFAAK